MNERRDRKGNSSQPTYDSARLMISASAAGSGSFKVKRRFALILTWHWHFVVQQRLCTAKHPQQQWQQQQQREAMAAAAPELAGRELCHCSANRISDRRFSSLSPLEQHLLSSRILGTGWESERARHTAFHRSDGWAVTFGPCFPFPLLSLCSCFDFFLFACFACV